MTRLKARQVGYYTNSKGYAFAKCTVCGKWSFIGLNSCPKCQAEFRGEWYAR